MSVNVSAGIFICSDMILIASRSKRKIYSDCWEFPGGKLENNESPYNALRREIKEELSIEVKSALLFDRYLYQVEKLQINLNFFYCKQWFGEFIPLDGQNLKWVSRKDILNFKTLPSNERVIKKILKFNWSVIPHD